MIFERTVSELIGHMRDWNTLRFTILPQFLFKISQTNKG